MRSHENDDRPDNLDDQGFNRTAATQPGDNRPLGAGRDVPTTDQPANPDRLGDQASTAQGKLDFGSAAVNDYIVADESLIRPDDGIIDNTHPRAGNHPEGELSPGHTTRNDLDWDNPKLKGF